MLFALIGERGAAMKNLQEEIVISGILCENIADPANRSCQSRIGKLPSALAVKQNAVFPLPTSSL